MPKILPKHKNHNYGPIERGTSLRIPVKIIDEAEKPIDLTGFNFSFTLKNVIGDNDMQDERPFIKIDGVPQEPTEGKFYIDLTSHQTQIPDREYWFDIQLVNPFDGMVMRLCTLSCFIVPGPTNRNTNIGTGQYPIGNEITIYDLAMGPNIVVIAPAVAIGSDFYSEMDDLKQRMTDLEDRMNDFESTMTTFETRLEHVEQTIVPMSQTIQDMQVQINKLADDLAILTARVDAL